MQRTIGAYNALKCMHLLRNNPVRGELLVGFHKFQLFNKQLRYSLKITSLKIKRFYLCSKKRFVEIRDDQQWW